MTAQTSLIPSLIHAAAKVIEDNAEEVTRLDQDIGDGDHVINLQRGLSALEALSGDLAQLDWPAALQKIAMSLMSSVGGASGSLYGTLFLAMGKALRDRTMSLENLAEAFAVGVDAMKQRGKADRGDKTMLDVLIPVSESLRSSAAEGRDWSAALADLDRAAETGCESTRDLVATKGRASFLGERSRGQLDAGARSSRLMIGAMAAVLAATN